MSVRGKIFGVTLGLVLATLLGAGVFLERGLRAWAESRIEHELVVYAQASQRFLEEREPELESGASERIAQDLGRSFEVRVTLVDSDGRVLGDSEVSPERIGALENHANRPEVKAAFSGSVGRSRRYSATIGMDTLYVAVPFRRPDGLGAVRVSMPLRELQTVTSHLRGLFVVAGLGALVIAISLSLLASHLMSKTLRTLVKRARVITAGTDRFDGGGSEDEIEGLAGSLNALARELDLKVSTLASERDRFESLLHGLSEAVIALDGQRRITLVNDSAMLLLGLDAPPTGAPLIEQLRVPEVDLVVEKALSGGDDQVVEFELASGDDRSPRIVLARATRLRASAGCVLVLHDVSEVRRLEAMRREFVANVSHELRTPVSVIRANAETLLDGALEDTQRARQFLDALVRNADRLSRILADLLDLSRLEAGRYALDLAPTCIEGVARSALDPIEAKAREKSIEIVSEVSPDIMAEVDARALEQVLANLIENAVKYTPTGGHVAVRSRRLGDQVRVEVIDDGPGIEPRHRARLFERFYRVDPGRSREVGGTGLGLAIVKHLVESMGGRVGMDPVVPHGAAFWLTLRASPLPDTAPVSVANG